MKLEELLAKIYDATQHTKPMGAHRTIITWLLQRAKIKLTLQVPPEGDVAGIPYPAYWAESEADWDKAQNIKWGEGQWS